MKILDIELIGEVSLEDGFRRNAGYRYDVPFDERNLPYLPIGRILRRRGGLPKNVVLGNAYPDGYAGIIRALSLLMKEYSSTAGEIPDCFTNSRYLPEKGYSIRSLKAGYHYCAELRCPQESVRQMEALLNGVTGIGICEEGITGEVRMTIRNHLPIRLQSPVPAAGEYHSLEYSVMFTAPVCMEMPYADEVKTRQYLPGTEVREALAKDMETGEMIFSNAYLSDGRQRLLPMPVCGSLVKLDKSQFRYRLAPGKLPERMEQDLNFDNAFTDDPLGHTVRYAVPETRRIATEDGMIHDALAAGQTFRGTVYGTDAAIRALAEKLCADPSAVFGDFCEEGFGGGYVRVENVREKEIPSPVYAKEFDVVCLSDLILLNENGMAATDPAFWLEELESLLGETGRLEIIGKYTELANECSRDPLWKTEREAVRCIAKGSVLRLRVRGDAAMDISAVRHTFIGERTAEGYGEIAVYPAKGEYYRLARREEISRYAMEIPVSERETILGMKLLEEVITNLLKKDVQGLAYIDREEYRKGVSTEDLLPMEIMRFIRDKRNPLVADAQLAEWYKEALESRE